MSLNSPILSRRSAEVADRFGRHASAYESHASLQAAVAERLADHFPRLKAPRVLELGCGTGLLSRHLLERYPDGEFTLTDVSPPMLAECARNLGDENAQRVHFEVMDASKPGAQSGLDLIVASMTLHWLPDPVASLARLRGCLAPGGTLLFAALGPDCFAEWRSTLAAERLPSGLAEFPALPGIIEDEHQAPDAEALAFLRRIRAVGGLTPRDGYAPLPPGKLRRAIRTTNLRFGGRVTWHIVYGRLGRA